MGIDGNSRVNEGTTAGSYICRLLFADYLTLLASSQQSALHRFSAACDHEEMKISTKKTEVFCLSRNPRRYRLEVSGSTLQLVEKFKYLGVVFTSGGRPNKEIDKRCGKANPVLREFYRSVVTKR